LEGGIKERVFLLPLLGRGRIQEGEGKDQKRDKV